MNNYSIKVQKTPGGTGRVRVSKKWLNATFLSFTGFASRIRSRAAKSAKYENLWVFIRSDAHVVRAGLNIRGCGPLSTLGFFDRLNARRNRACQIYLFLSQLRAFSSTYSLLVALLLFSYLSPQVMSMAYLPPSL